MFPKALELWDCRASANNLVWGAGAARGPRPTRGHGLLHRDFCRSAEAHQRRATVPGLWSQAPRSPPWLLHQRPLHAWKLLGDPCPGPPLHPSPRHRGPLLGHWTAPRPLHVADPAFPAFLPALWTFLWFVGFCFLTNQWAATKKEDVLVGADSARAAITFSFFSIFSWVGGPGRVRAAVPQEKGGGRLRNPKLGAPCRVC